MGRWVICSEDAGQTVGAISTGLRAWRQDWPSHAEKYFAAAPLALVVTWWQPLDFLGMFPSCAGPWGK